MFKRLLPLVVLLGLCSSVVEAKTTYDLSEFSTRPANVNIGPLTVDGDTFLKVGLSSDFEIWDLTLGLDLNLYVGDNVPNNFNTVVVRKIKYEYDDSLGIEWGRLKHVTLGNALLMDNYDSGAFGSYEFSNKKAGAKGFLEYEPLRVEALYTSTQVLGARLEYTFSDSLLLGSPVSIGGSYVHDKDGINTSYDGVAIFRPEQKGWSADVTVPIAGEYLKLFSEYAELTEGLTGNGISAGVRGKLINRINYRAEHRTLGAGFIPGYFDHNYEATSQTEDPIQDKTVTGFLGGLGVEFGDHFKASGTYEKYEDSAPILSGALGWRSIFNTAGVVNYTESFGGNDSAVLSSDVVVRTDGVLAYVLHFKRIYQPGGPTSDSYGVSIQMRLDNFFKIPFSN